MKYSLVRQAFWKAIIRNGESFTFIFICTCGQYFNAMNKLAYKLYLLFYAIQTNNNTYSYISAEHNMRYVMVVTLK